MRKGLLLLIAVCAWTSIPLAAVASQGPAVLEEGSTQMVVEAAISPPKLPVDRRVPALLILALTNRSVNGGEPPSLERLSVELDRSLAFDLKDIPTCDLNLIRRSTRSDPTCPKAIVGSGTIAFEPPVHQGPVCCVPAVLVYNGGLVHGNRRLWLRYTEYGRLPPDFVTPLDIKRTGSGRFGSRLIFSFSRVANAGSAITQLHLTLMRLLGSCPTGSLKLGVSGAFTDETHPAGVLHQRCYPR